jgi:hypothetical protein
MMQNANALVTGESIAHHVIRNHGVVESVILTKTHKVLIRRRGYMTLLGVASDDQALVDTMVAWCDHDLGRAASVFPFPICRPCTTDALNEVEKFIVDGTRDFALAIAESARLAALGRPVGLLCKQSVMSIAARSRTGVDVVLTSPLSRGDFERFILIDKFFNQGGDESSSRASVISPRVHIDFDRRLLVVDGVKTVISAQRFDVLCYFLDCHGAAVSPQDLVRKGLLRPSQAKRFKGFMQELKQLLGPARDVVSAVPGFGYRIDVDGINR